MNKQNQGSGKTFSTPTLASVKRLLKLAHDLYNNDTHTDLEYRWQFSPSWDGIGYAASRVQAPGQFKKKRTPYCSICKQQAAVWAWQPFGPSDTQNVFTVLGSHYRGFHVFKVCDECKSIIERGEMVRVKYKGQEAEIQPSGFSITTKSSSQ